MFFCPNSCAKTLFKTQRVSVTWPKLLQLADQAKRGGSLTAMFFLHGYINDWWFWFHFCPIFKGKKCFCWCHTNTLGTILRRFPPLCKTPHFQWIYGKLNQIYEKLRSDQMDPKSALGGPKPISRTGGSLLKNWSYTSNQCIYFSILLYWRPHLAKTLFILHKYIKCALL